MSPPHPGATSQVERSSMYFSTKDAFSYLIEIVNLSLISVSLFKWIWTRIYQMNVM